MATSSAGHSPATSRVVATIEARMTSSRLPGKVLADIGGIPMLEMLVRRVRRSQTVTDICVATTTNPDDDEVVALAERLGVLVWRGSEDDVLGRVVEAATHAAADVVVELTGDCPMVDPTVLDACTLAWFAEDLHYCGNHLTRTFPLGLDVKVFAADLLVETAGATDDPAHREHVSLHLYEDPTRYRVRNVVAVGDLHRPSYRWTVDTGEDLELVRAVVARLGHDFSARDAARLLDAEPDLATINRDVPQRPVR